MDFVESVSRLLKETAEHVVKSEPRLSSYKDLGEFLVGHFDQVADDMMKVAKLKVENLLEREQIPYTQNDYLSETLRKLRSEWLQKALLEGLGLHDFKPTDYLHKSAIKQTVLAIFDRNRDKAIDVHMAEDMEHVLNAYGKIAGKRFMDDVPMICGTVLHGYSEEMETCLWKVSDDEIDEIVVASEKAESDHEYLQSKVNELQSALAIIRKLERYSR